MRNEAGPSRIGDEQARASISLRAELEQVKDIVRQNNRLLKSIVNHLMAEEDEEELLVQPFTSHEQLESFFKKFQRSAFRKKVVS